MEFVQEAIGFILHIDAYLEVMVSQIGLWVYAILFLVVFFETGIVVTPFLPGDSLLFASGAIAAHSELSVGLLIMVFLSAAILGDAVNYMIGKYFGEKLVTRYPRLIKPEYIERTRNFFARHGGKTIVLARFVPVVRTIAPFLAGSGEMKYTRFLKYNIVGALTWVFLLVPAGFYFANAQFVKDNFSVVLLAIVGISLLPAFVEIVRSRYSAGGDTGNGSAL